MIFVADNGIRFRDKDEVSFIGDFITGKDKHISIFLAENLVLVLMMENMKVAMIDLSKVEY